MRPQAEVGFDRIKSAQYLRITEFWGWRQTAGASIREFPDGDGCGLTQATEILSGRVNVRAKPRRLLENLLRIAANPTPSRPTAI